MRTPAPARNSYLRSAMADGMPGIWFQVDRMIEYVRNFAGDPEIVDFSRTLVLGCPPRDQKCEVKAIHAFMRKRARFVQDPTHKEVISTPVKLLDDVEAKGLTSGDCDELSTLEAALLAAVGIKPRFRFGGEGSEMSHVWVQALLGTGHWVDLEPSGYLEPGLYYAFPSYETREIFTE